MKKLVLAALFLSISAFSCGTTVPRTEVGDFAAPTESATEPPTEPPTEGNLPPVEVNPQMPEGYELAKKCVIDGFEAVLQNPELPTGCEITALTQTLNFYGFDIDKVTLIKLFLTLL